MLSFPVIENIDVLEHHSSCPVAGGASNRYKPPYIPLAALVALVVGCAVEPRWPIKSGAVQLFWSNRGLHVCLGDSE